MKNPKKVISCTLLALLALSPLAYFGYIKYQDDHFTCQTEVKIIKKNSEYSAIVNFHFEEGNGTINTAGVFKEDGVEVARINKKLAFVYWNEGKSTIMVSSIEHADKDTVAQLNTLTPDFFLYSDRGMLLQLKRENASTYLFVQAGTPIFSCLINKT